MRKLFFLLLASAGLASCSGDFFSQTLDIEQPEYEKQLVLHGFGGNLDSNFRISLTRNYGILENVPSGSWAVPGASVELFEGGQKVATLTASPDLAEIYEAAIQPGFFQPGKTYELRATHPDYPAVTARQTIPQPAQVDSVRFRENGGVNDDGDKVSAIDVFLKDPAGVENYYEIRLVWVYPILEVIYDSNGNPIDVDTVGFQANLVTPQGSDDPNVQETYGGGLAVSDRLFDGQPYRFVVKTYNYGVGDEIFQVVVRSVTKEYYLWALSAQRKFDTEDFPLAEPVTIYSNLDNGIGVFGLWHEQAFEIEL